MKLLERHFEIALETPDGITKLRELILSLAMQGKLVPQDPKDKPASELLKEIETEKKKLIKESKIRNQEPLPPIKPEEISYEVPKGWIWVRLNDFGMWKSGSTPSRSNSSYYGGKIPWVKSGEVKQGKIIETSETITQAALENCPLAINPIDSVLIAMYGANIGDVGILEIEATTNQAVCACKTYSSIDNLFLYKLLQSLKPSFISQGAGAAQPNISREKIINQVAPLPPFVEQKRIVAKIDQLMALCDKLETERNERDKKRLAIHTAAVNRLLTATDKTDFNMSWSFINKNFSALYAVPENVEDLKKAVLQLAVMGKLVPQDPKDNPALELLKEIEAEKRKLIKEGKIKKQEPLSPIKPEEIPYALPKGWAWVRLNDVFDVRDGTHDTPKYASIGVPLITSKNIYTGTLSFDDVKFISDEDHIKIKERSNVERGDILFAMIGSIGNPVIVDTDQEFSIKNVALFKYYNSNLSDKNYLHNFLISSQSLMKSRSSGAVQSFVSLSFLRNYLFPLPPLAEQKRIVAKIDQFMELCNTLAQQIKDATEKQTAILDSVLARL